MKATKKEIQRLAKSLKEDFKRGVYHGSYSERLEKIVLGFDNVTRSDDGIIGVHVRGGRCLDLWFDVL
ncbi:hypothetical protein QM480_17190 [Flectobacillus sp. DC10W]|uniref:Uncharacterized protein n=1 Tax=Flectobacillus longus TaxID=2984207 RepID=A0ABT6YRD8_9BACT|nr:hypothetical protein [Flectobacillus longus]MDI9866080.1 hypothetical protein [Flectobacillus longus]